MRSSIVKRPVGSPVLSSSDTPRQGWGLEAPGDDVKEILTRQRAGQRLSDRDWERLSHRIVAENETARLGGQVTGAIQPKKRTAFELGQRDRQAVAEDERELDEYSAGRGFPVKPAGPTREQLAARRNGTDRVGAGGFAMRTMAGGRQSSEDPNRIVLKTSSGLSMTRSQWDELTERTTPPHERASRASVVDSSNRGTNPTSHIAGLQRRNLATFSVPLKRPALALGGDDRDLGLRRAFQNRQSDVDSQVLKDERSVQEADYRKTGKKFYTNASGDLVPQTDEQGRQQYVTTPWKKRKDPKSGLPSLARRNNLGEQEYKMPVLRHAADLADPNIYADFGADGQESLGHVDDLVKHSDPKIAREAAIIQKRRQRVARASSIQPLQEAYDAAKLEVDLVKRNDDLDPRIQRDGRLSRKMEAAKLDLDMWKNRSAHALYEDLANERRSILRRIGQSENDDATLKGLLEEQSRFNGLSDQSQAPAADERLPLNAEPNGERGALLPLPDLSAVEQAYSKLNKPALRSQQLQKAYEEGYGSYRFRPIDTLDRENEEMTAIQAEEAEMHRLERGLQGMSAVLERKGREGAYKIAADREVDEEKFHQAFAAARRFNGAANARRERFRPYNPSDFTDSTNDDAVAAALRELAGEKQRNPALEAQLTKKIEAMLQPVPTVVKRGSPAR